MVLLNRKEGNVINPYINKFLVALVTVLGTASILVSDGVDTTDIIAMVVLFLNAYGVYAIPNSPPK